MKKIFKRFLIPVIALGLLASLTGCITLPQDEVLNSLGAYESRVFYSFGEFRDYTDYAKYEYDTVDFDGNPYFEKLQERDLPEIHRHLDDFEGWIEIIGDGEKDSELVDNFDFDRSWIDLEDFFYLYSEEHTWGDGYTSLVNYNLYFFDSQTCVLYYFHNDM